MKKLLITAFILAFGLTSFAAAEDVTTEAKLYYNLGVDHYKVGLYDKSMEAFRKAICEYQKRERRFGKTSEQVTGETNGQRDKITAKDSIKL